MQTYSKFFRTYSLFLVGLSLVGLIGGLLLSRFLPDSYDVSLALNIERKQDKSRDFYTYDGYYAIQATELFSKNVATWFITPDFVEDILSDAEKIDIQNISVKDFRRFFQAEQVASNIVEVQFGVKESADGEILTQAIRSSIDNYVQTKGIEDYIITIGQPVIRLKVYNPVFFSLGGLILSLTLGLALASVKEYFGAK